MKNNLDILLITETWLDRTFTDSQFHIPGFRLLRLDRSVEFVGKETGGGVCFYVRTDFGLM